MIDTQWPQETFMGQLPILIEIEQEGGEWMQVLAMGLPYTFGPPGAIDSSPSFLGHTWIDNTRVLVNITPHADLNMRLWPLERSLDA
jgi:hypothetical protein